METVRAIAGQRGGQRDQKQGGRYNRDANENDDHQDNHQDNYQHGRGDQGRSSDGHDYSRQNKDYDYQDRARNSPQNNNRFPNGNRGQINGGYQTNGRTYTGTVTRVRSNTSFDVNINGSTFNVYLDTPAPRGLTKGDTVRINGVQQDKNDIRYATVSVLRNR